MKFELWANHYSSDCRLIPKNTVITLLNAKTGQWGAEEPARLGGQKYSFEIKPNEDGSSPFPSSNCKPLDAEARDAFKKKFPNAKIDVPPPAPLSQLKVKGSVGNVPDLPKVPE